MIKVCEYCGKEFEAKRKDKRFCSSGCRSQFWKNNPKNAPVETFQNVSPEQKSPPVEAVTDAIVRGFDRILEKMDNNNTDALIGTTSRSVDLETEIRDTLQDILEEIKRLRIAPATMPDAPVLVSGNMSQLSGQVAARDTSADDDLLDLLEVKEVKSEGSQATQNFINSMLGMQNAKSTKDPDARPVRKIKQVRDLGELIEIKAS